MKTVIRDSFEIAEATFWDAIFFNPEFQRRVYIEALGCESVTVGDVQNDADGKRTRSLSFTQKLDAPGAVRKLFGETTTMEERGTFDPVAKRWRFAMIPDRMPDKIRISGETWFVTTGPGQIERVCELDLSVSIFGVGSLVEKFMASATVESLAKQTRFIRAYIAEKKLA